MKGEGTIGLPQAWGRLEGAGTLSRISPQDWGARGAELRTNLSEK